MPVRNILASPVNDQMLASWDDSVRLWSVDGQFLRTLEGHSDTVSSVAFSPDGQMLASASLDDTVRLWGIEK